MSTPIDTNVKIIENAQRDDVRPGDHITWERTWTARSVTCTEIREGIAHHRDAFGNWRTKEGDCITAVVGEDEGVTITIRRPVQDIPTEPGTVIVVNDGHEYVTITHMGETYRAREAILTPGGLWMGVWRSTDNFRPYADPDQINPGTWKVGNR